VLNSDAEISMSKLILLKIFSSTVFLYVNNDPIIESSSNLKFAPYNVSYPLLDKHATSVGFDPSKIFLVNIS